jgi:hypothetical protein
MSVRQSKASNFAKKVRFTYKETLRQQQALRSADNPDGRAIACSCQWQNYVAAAFCLHHSGSSANEDLGFKCMQDAPVHLEGMLTLLQAKRGTTQPDLLRRLPRSRHCTRNWHACTCRITAFLSIQAFLHLVHACFWDFFSDCIDHMAVK